jgi:hypothetical protein
MGPLTQADTLYNEIKSLITIPLPLPALLLHNGCPLLQFGSWILELHYDASNTIAAKKLESLLDKSDKASATIGNDGQKTLLKPLASVCTPRNRTSNKHGISSNDGIAMPLPANLTHPAKTLSKFLTNTKPSTLLSPPLHRDPHFLYMLPLFLLMMLSLLKTKLATLYVAYVITGLLEPLALRQSILRRSTTKLTRKRKMNPIALDGISL